MDDFEAEMMSFALDGDTAQHFVAFAAERWGMTPPEVLRRLGAALARGELRLYIDDDEGVARDVVAHELTPALLKAQVYTWMACTPRR